MDIGEFKAGYRRKGNHYQYFLPEKINHDFVCSDTSISGLLEKASLKLANLTLSKVEHLRCVRIIGVSLFN